MNSRIGQILKEKLSLAPLLQVLCTCLTLVLVYQEVVTYTKTRPTTSSLEQTGLEDDSFPQVSVCLDPPLSKERAQSYGYDMTVYFRGLKHFKSGFVGWNGTEQEANSSEILEDIFTVKKDLKMIKGFFTTVEIYKKWATVSFKQPMYPFGKCFLINPEQINPKDIEKVVIIVNPPNPQYNPSVNVHLSDSTNAI